MTKRRDRTPTSPWDQLKRSMNNLSVQRQLPDYGARLAVASTYSLDVAGLSLAFSRGSQARSWGQAMVVASKVEAAYVPTEPTPPPVTERDFPWIPRAWATYADELAAGGTSSQTGMSSQEVA